MAQFATNSEVTTKLAQEVQQELPTIYVSVKNLIAYAMGKSYETPLEPRIQPQNAMTCAKYLLQAIRSHPLPDVEQFCAENPQPEDQLGVDRLEDICKYKVIYALRYKAEEKGGRITRLFGKSYIRWSKSWNVFRKKTVDLLQENTHIPMEEIEFFLQTYEASLKVDDNNRDRSSTVSTEDLIWANDFNAMLTEMQKERGQRVEERKRASTDELQALEQQLFAPSISGSGSGGSQQGSRPASQEIGSLDMLLMRSRATTMEQLGLEPPSLEGLMRLPSSDGQQVTPADRSRATTLDLFAYEQQSHNMAGNNAMFLPSPRHAERHT